MYIDKCYETPQECLQRLRDEEQERQARARRELERRRERESSERSWQKIEADQWLDSRGPILCEVTDYEWRLWDRKPFMVHARQYTGGKPKIFTVNWQAVEEHALGSRVVSVMYEWCSFMYGPGGVFRKWSTHKARGETIWDFSSERMRSEFVLRWQGRLPSTFRPTERPEQHQPTIKTPGERSSQQVAAVVSPMKMTTYRNHTTNMYYGGGGHY